MTANPALLTLLTGPRWAIGPRDLRLLAERAGELSGARGRQEVSTIADQLLGIADGVDPSELPALGDALLSPGEAAYSPEALERFALLSAELRRLRAYVGDPLLDVVRRIIDVTGVDVELASAVSESATARRDNVDLFVKAVADFQSVDGDVTLPALLAYLTAEDEQGNGLDIATPTAADSVKLLTVHRSKGLEWSSVFCVGVVRDPVPLQPVADPVDLLPGGAPRTAARGRGRPAAAGGMGQGGAGRLPGADQGARRGGGAAPGLRRVHPCRPPPGRDLALLGPAGHPVRALGLPALRPRAPGGSSAVPVERWLDKPERGTPNPNDQVDSVAGLAPPPVWAARRSVGSSRPSWSAPSTRRLRTRAWT